MMERIAAKPVTTAIHDASMDSATYKLDYMAPVTHFYYTELIHQ